MIKLTKRFDSEPEDWEQEQGIRTAEYHILVPGSTTDDGIVRSWDSHQVSENELARLHTAIEREGIVE